MQSRLNWSIWTPRAVLFLAVLSTVFIAWGLQSANEGDVAWYQWMIHDWAAGHLPYVTHPVEYPPYALGIFLLPWLMGDHGYLINFMLLALGLEVGSKFLLGWHSLRVQRFPGDLKSWLPLVLFSGGELFLSYFLLQRYDIWPAVLTLIAVLLAYHGRWWGAGIFLALGIGAKLYPLLFVLPLAALAFRQDRKALGRFLGGGLLGLLPLFLLSFFLPWWKFLLIQGGRGLQVESLAASLLWIVHHFVAFPLSWVRATAWYELQGPVAFALVPWTKVLFGGAVLVSVMGATVAAWRWPTAPLSRWASWLLCPLTAFVAFNSVFSPQYMIWLLALAALAVLDQPWWPAVCLFVAMVLTPQIYPVPDYFTGLNWWHTLALLTRNLLVLTSWLGFVFICFKKDKRIELVRPT